MPDHKKPVLSLLPVILVFAFVAQSAYAVNVGIYNEPENGDPQGYCVEVSEGADAFKTLSELQDAEFDFINDQHILCGIDNNNHFVCDQESDRSVRVVLQHNGKWLDESIPSYDAGNKCYDSSFNSLLNFIHYSFVSHTFSNTHYCARQGDVLGVIDETRPKHQPGPPDFSYTPTYAELCEPIRIDKIKAYVNGAKENLDELGDKIKGVYPGSELRIELSIKNVVPKNIEREIVDVVAKATLKNIYGINDGSQKSKPITLDSGEKADLVFTFLIPASAEEDTYKLFIKIEGYDDFDFSFETETEFKVNVVKEKHKLVINELYMERPEICAGASGTIIGSIINIGASDETGTLLMKNDKLGFASSLPIKIEEDSTNNIRKEVLIPSTAEPGFYHVTASLSYSEGNRQYPLNLTVRDCGKESVNNKPVTQSAYKEVNLIQGFATASQDSGTSGQVKRTAPAISNNTQIAILLLVSIFLVYVCLLAILLKKQKKYY